MKKLPTKEFNKSELNHDIRLMTFEELFESRLQYFKEHSYKFTESQYKFLKSIQHYKIRLGLTKKQKNAFISVVDSVWFSEYKH